MRYYRIYQFALNIVQSVLDNACMKMDTDDYADLLHELQITLERRLTLVERGIHEDTE